MDDDGRAPVDVLVAVGRNGPAFHNHELRNGHENTTCGNPVDDEGSCYTDARIDGLVDDPRPEGRYRLGEDRLGGRPPWRSAPFPGIGNRRLAFAQPEGSVIMKAGPGH